MTLGRERAIADAFLLSGDEDLREGVRAAQDMGVRVTLLGIPPVTQDFNQSKELVQEADEVHVIEKAALEPFMQLIEPELPTPLPGGGPDLAENDVEKLGETFGAEWYANAAEPEQAALLAQRPRIPKTLDVELTKSAEERLKRNFRGQDQAHRALRRGFWTGIPAQIAED